MTFNVSAPVTGNVVASPSSLTFQYTIGGPVPNPASVYITAASNSTYQIPFSATGLVVSPAGGPWLSVSSGTSGTTPANLSVAVTPTGLAAGTYQGVVAINPTGGPILAVPVTLTVSPTPTLSTSAASVSFVYTPPGGFAAAPQTLRVTNSSGSSSVAFTAQISGNSSNWLSVSPASGIIPASLTLSVTPGGLTPGTYNANLVLTPSAGAPLTVAVSLTVTPPSVFVTSQLVFGYASSGPAPPPQTVQVMSSDGSAQPFSVSADPNGRISFAPSNATTPATLSISVAQSGLALTPKLDLAGYSTSLGLSPANDPSLQTALNVSLFPVPPGALVAAPASLNLSYQVGGSPIPPQPIRVFTVGSVFPVSFSAFADGANWLSVSPVTTTSPATLTASISTTGLSPGVYTNTIYISPSLLAVASIQIPVTLTVTSVPPLSVSPPDLSFSFANSQSSPIQQTIQVTAAGGAAVPFTVGLNDGAPGIEVNPQTATTPATLTLSVSPSSISPGPHTGVLAVTPTASGNPATLYSVEVSVGPVLSVSPGSLGLVCVADGGSPPPQALQLTASNYGAVGFSTQVGGVGLFATPPFGTTNATVYVLTYCPELGPATYYGHVTLDPSTSVPATVTVTSTVQPTIIAVANAASYADNAVAPGEIVAISGSLLGPANGLGLTLDASGNVATSVGGVSVNFSGYPAPLTYVSATQINCVVPYELAGTPNPWVQVQVNGASSNIFPLTLTGIIPGVFTQYSTGFAAVLNTAGCPDGAATCLNGSSTPAPQGSTIVIYVTGEGQTNPPGVTGSVTAVDQKPGDPLTPQPQTPSVTIGGQPAIVSFYGEAPGVVAGVLQINARVPTGLPPGNQPLIVSIGGTNTQSGVVIAIQGEDRYADSSDNASTESPFSSLVSSSEPYW